MRKYLKDFMTEYDYPTEAVELLLAAFDKIQLECGTDFDALVELYETSKDIDYKAAIDKMKELSEKSGVHEYVGAFVLLLCFTRRLREYYHEAKIPDSVYRNTVLDLKYKLDECKCVCGIYGTFVAIWFSGFFKLERFAFGRLQFELIPLGVDYAEDDVFLTKEQRVINVHIPRTGTRLLRESVLESYRMAADFWRGELDGKIAFVCSSWLLFPRHLQMLKAGANLLDFISDYTLIASGEYNGYGEVWRLFDMNYDGFPDRLPADTSLRRAYVELIRRGEKTGWGRGIFIYNN